MELKNKQTAKISDNGANLYIEMYKFGSELEQVIETIKKQSNKAITFIDDCSYSMDYDIRNVRETTKKIYNEVVSDGDVVSGIAFASARRDKDFIRPTYVSDKVLQRDTIFSEIDKELHTYGCTDYLSPLVRYNEKHAKFIDSYYGKDIDTKYVFFFTDGWPNDCYMSDVLIELKKVHEDTVFIYVGFGNYYNRETLCDMQKITGGNIVHCDDMDNYLKEVTGIVGGSGGSTKFIKSNILDLGIDANNTTIVDYVIHDGSDSIMVQKNNGVISSLSEDFTYVRVVTERTANTPKIVEKTSNYDTDIVRIGYATSYVLSKTTNKLLSYFVMNNLPKDVKLTNDLYKASTNTEYNEVETSIKNSISDVNLRYVEGFKKVPKSNLPTLFQVIKVLVKHGAMVKPITNKNTKKISVTSKYITEGVPSATFTSDGYVKLKDSSLSYGSKSEGTMNITLNFTQHGELEVLKEDQKSLNRLFLPVAKSKSYTLVEFSEFGGRPLGELGVIITQDCLDELININAMPKNSKKLEFSLNISKYPVYKMSLENKELSSKEFADMVYELQRLRVQKSLLNKVIENEKELLKNDENVQLSEFTDEQIEMLREKYKYAISKSGNAYQYLDKTYHESFEVNHAPTKSELENSDTEYSNFYTAKFDVVANKSTLSKGGKLNSIPSGATILKALEKVTDEKKANSLTIANRIAYDFVQNEQLNSSGVVYLARLNELNKELSERISDLELSKAETMIEHIWGKVKFDNQTGDEFTYSNDDFSVTVSIGTTKKYFGKYFPKA